MMSTNFKPGPTTGRKAFYRPSGRTRPRLLSIVGVVAMLCVATACGSETNPSTSDPTDTSTVVKKVQEWNEKMQLTPLPAKGCFDAAYPNETWTPVQCTTAPDLPYPPGGGSGQQTVGGATDFVADVTGPNISSATGSFPSVSGVTSESGNVSGSAPAVANTYSLQLNTRPFATSVCAGHASCHGWQQFVYSNAGIAFIQYWLLQFNAACPAGWNTFQFPADTDIYCWENGPNAVTVTKQPITNLASLSLTGTASAGAMDSVIMSTGGGSNLNAANQDSILNLASAWQGIEFIVVGDCCSSEATFNANSTIVVRTTVHNGTTNAPICTLTGFTGETNNLTLVGAPVFAIAPSPAIESTQSNIPGTAATCAAAKGIGDTHLQTFSGLLYDFQASGDFVLAQAKDFSVQTRQVSGAPTWPNASVNQAVATQMGGTRVAVCATSKPLVIDGESTTIGEGETRGVGPGVQVTRTGNVYLITDDQGNSVRAVVNSSWIDVFVGLGAWPTDVHGLLANAGGDVNLLETSDGSVLQRPIEFEDLYRRYGESWRVAPSDSLLEPCGGQDIERGVPTQTFEATDLDPEVHDRSQEICARAGVKDPALLDACTLDVAVLGGEQAPEVYIGASPPVEVGTGK